MTPIAIIEKARLDGVTLALSPSGTIKARGESKAVKRWVAIIRSHKSAIVDMLKAGEAAAPLSDGPRNAMLDKLIQFRFDLVREEIAAGYSAEDLHRVNNMAWEFMQADGMAFHDAVWAASGIASQTRAAACEAAYVDAMALFEKQARSAVKS